jgi:hypothetical protein
MGSPLASYTPEVMQTTCDRCGAKKLQRCMGSLGSALSNVIPAHNVRLAQLGLRWNRKTSTLEAL